MTSPEADRLAFIAAQERRAEQATRAELTRVASGPGARAERIAAMFADVRFGRVAAEVIEAMQ